MKTAQRYIYAPIQCIFGVAILLCLNSAYAEDILNPHPLSKALNGVAWKQVTHSIVNDVNFQNSVRPIFNSLTLEGQKKVTASISEIKEGKGPIITNTPFDALVAKEMAKALERFVFAADAKESLLRIAENGDLVDLMSVLPKTPVETKPIVSVPNKGPAVVANNGKNFFVGPKWTSRVGTEFLFFDNKTGTMTKAARTVPFKWSKKDGMILVEAETTYYFKFQESGDSFFGVRLNDITQFVKPEPGKGQMK